MRYVIQDKEAGNLIDVFETKEQAEIELKKYEEQDKKDNCYTEDFYEIEEQEEKIYKVWAQCCRRPKGKGIEEVNEETARNLINEAVDDMFNNGDIDFNEEEWEKAQEEGIEYWEYTAKYYDEALKQFENDGVFGCGDFLIMKSYEMPDRPNIADYSKEFLNNIK